MDILRQSKIGGRYSVVEPLGHGGMARVYLARDEVLGRDVAVKLLDERFVRDEEVLERFRREGQSMAALSHPNIVPVFDQGTSEDGSHYMAMEYLPGGSLNDVLEQRRLLPPAAAVEVALQVAEALKEAHENGVVHRDIKPQNVLVTKGGDVKVADFGIALDSNMTALTRGQYVLGTTRYMSPEQAHGEAATPKSDLYSLGVVLYEMLAGQVPYDAETPLGVAVKHASDEPPPAPREINPDIPEHLNALTLLLLAKDPDERPESADSLIEALGKATLSPASFVAGPVAAPVPVGTEGGTGGSGDPAAKPKPERSGKATSSRTFRRRPVAWAALIVLSLAALALTGILASGILSGIGGRPEQAAGEGAVGGAVGSGQRVEVPDVKDLTGEEAEKKLAGIGLQVQKEDRESAPEEEGEVLSQSPAAGESADRESEMSLVIGGGPATVEVPDLNYVKFPEAEARLEDLGLEVGGKKIIHDHQFDYEKYPKDVVLKQDPAIGEEVEAGTKINLEVACKCDAGDHEGGY